MSHSANWYKNPDSLVDELRKNASIRGISVTIPGYRDLHEIRQGGQGTVYSAIQESTGQRVAVKVLHDRTLPQKSGRRRFEREIEIVTSLRHPNIVRVYDSGRTSDDRVYSIMEYIEGVPLDDHLSGLGVAGGRPPIRKLLELFVKICDAVHHANQHGVVHRDLKP